MLLFDKAAMGTTVVRFHICKSLEDLVQAWEVSLEILRKVVLGCNEMVAVLFTEVLHMAMMVEARVDHTMHTDILGVAVVRGAGGHLGEVMTVLIQTP